jgi:hypothetical protein
MAARPLGSEGAAMEQQELAALASEKSPAAMQQEQKLVVKGPRPMLVAWTNAGAVADDNVFKHPDDWTAPDDPARATVTIVPLACISLTKFLVVRVLLNPGFT